MKSKNLKIATLAALVSVNAWAGEQEIDFTTPSINPARECITDGMVNARGKEYRYLYSRDCRVVHVLPPGKVKPDIKGRGVNLGACKGFELQNEALNAKIEKVALIDTELRDLEKKLAKAESESEQKAIEKKIEKGNAKAARYREEAQAAQITFDQYYDNTPGALYSILLDSQITQTELNNIRGDNRPSLAQKKIIEEHYKDENSADQVKVREEIVESAVRPAALPFSIYSFDYKTPGKAGLNGGVISTSLPNLEYLEQQQGHTSTIHVKSGDLVSGDIVMSLKAICERTKKNPDGTYALNEEFDPLFSVTRTFGVQQTFAQGYVASLKVDNVINQIVKHTTTNTEKGFEKSSLFGSTIDTKIDELLDFEWTTEFENKDAISLAAIQEIKKTVTEKLINDYFDDLIKAGLIKIADPEDLPPAKGGYVDETHVATRCWSERRGGISGAFGGRRTVCSDFTYVVQVWRDGMTTEELNKLMKLNVEAKEVMKINTNNQFYFTTVFKN